MTTSKSKKDPEIEIKAKMNGSDEWKEWSKSKNNINYSNHGTSGALYFVGFVGSLVYWIQAAVGFGAVITAFLKSLVWPAYIVYKLLESFYGVVI
jgi:hypothetical protein